MIVPNRPVLRQLHNLDKSLSEFDDQLGVVLYGEEYKQCVTKIQGKDLAWLVDYLDKVCLPSSVPSLHLSRCRLLMASLPPAIPSGSVYTNSEAYVESGRHFPHRTSFPLV
jgi:hypothetical protein